MAVFKCKMCGGTIEFEEGATVGVCEYCGSKQTLPKTTDDTVANLFNRANNLRRKSEFDKAEAIYEKIVQMDDSEAEAHWGIVLCKFGIEYVEDPNTLKRIPTCHRTSFESITTDPDFQSAIDYSDAVQQTIYNEEARAIDRIQRDILSVVKNEEPFDVFICYKETDENGKRTTDSVFANEIYHQLTQEGFKVFYAAITLEDKLGQEYEPYIFAALNSAKVMLVVGSKPEYFEAVWVKNEWSRFLKLMKTNRQKLLIPCYKDMDAYDLPEEFAHLQAQDMSKIGFINDITRGIKKIIEVDEPKNTVKETVVVNNAAASNTEPLLKRAFMFLEDGKWQEADEYCEKVLDLDPECARAYLGKLMAELEVSNESKLKNVAQPFDENDHCIKASRFDSDLAEKLKEANNSIRERNELKRKTDIYNSALSSMKKAKTEKEYKSAATEFNKIKGFKDAEEKAKECLDKSDEIKRKAEADKQDAEELYQMLVKALKDKKNGSLSTEEKLSAKKKEKESEIKTISEKIASFEEKAKKAYNLQSQLEALKAELVKKNELKAQTEEKRAELESQLSSLGLFAGSKKKELRTQIAEIDEVLNKFIVEILKFESKKAALLKEIAVLGGSVPEIEAEIQKSKSELSDTEIKFNREIAELESQLEAEKKSGKIKLSVEEIIAKIEKNPIAERKCKMLVLKVGDTIKFGNYYVSSTNCKEPIEWQVLAKEDSRILVISKYALDCVEYNEKYEDTTWETCTLRRWLNNEFYNNAFSAEEQEQIQKITVSADKNPKYSTNPGKSINDKVFLPSITEVEKYFSSNSARQCEPTEYAMYCGANTDSCNEKCWWWLRSPGGNQDYATCVYHDGSVHYDGICAGDYDCVGVRPALWVSLES